ncbi:alpha/beta hydrolase [Tahibacter aquaticus]|nr:alpha/beta hydrolase [Tahibacter aquaticus]
MNVLRRMAVAALALAVLAYAAYAALFYTAQRQLLFPLADTVRHPFRTALTTPAQLVEPTVSFGHARGVFLPAAATPAPALLFFHGNGETIDQHLDTLAALNTLGLNVFLLELPGYAGADGAPTFDSLVEASTAAYDWLAQDSRVDKRKIVAFGRSIGGAPAAELSRHRPLAALVLLSTFASTADLARDHFLPPFLALDPFDSAARIREFSGAVLLMHGDNDEVIPAAHARRMAGASPRAQLHTEPCGHNDCRYFGAALLPLLRTFLQAHQVLPTP